jgi:hypothetical protein
MADSADAITLERAAEAPGETLHAHPPAGLAFEPEVFFMGRTEGAGVVRDPVGRIVRRCHVTTEGGFNTAQRLLRFDETFAYDDGEVDVWRWVMQPGRDGRYVAAEVKAGAGITGERQGDDYVLAFRRPVGRAAGPFAPRFRTRFTLLNADLAMKRANVSLFGLPLGVLVAVHRRVTA